MTFDEFIEKVKEFEGFRDKAYLCPSGVPTIGYGRTNNVKLGDTTTREKENEWIEGYLKQTLKNVSDHMSGWGYHCTSNQLLALADFVFNCGIANLVNLTDDGKRDLKTISSKILLYNKSNGKVLEGLVKRRKWEYNLFNTTTVAESVMWRQAIMQVKIRGYEHLGWLSFNGQCTTLDGVDYAAFVNCEGGLKLMGEELEIVKVRFVGHSNK